MLGSPDTSVVQFPSLDTFKSQLPKSPIDVQVCSANHRLLLACLCRQVAHSADFQLSAEDMAAFEDLIPIIKSLI